MGIGKVMFFKQNRTLQHFRKSNKSCQWREAVFNVGASGQSKRSLKAPPLSLPRPTARTTAAHFAPCFHFHINLCRGAEGLKIPIRSLLTWQVRRGKIQSVKSPLFFFFCLFLSAAVPRNSQLPPSVEHASVLAVWDWGVQSHLPLHLRPEELLHRWVIQHTVSRRSRCPFQAATLIISRARFSSLSLSPPLPRPLRSDPGLGEWQRPGYLLLRALLLEVQDTFPPVRDDLGGKPAQLDWLFHQAAGEW